MGEKIVSQRKVTQETDEIFKFIRRNSP